MKNTIDALALKKAFIAGANNLDNKKDYINELNVFPVPDGDTGTNMTMTDHTECIRCGKCIKECPAEALRFRYGFSKNNKCKGDK